MDGAITPVYTDALPCQATRVSIYSIHVSIHVSIHQARQAKDMKGGMIYPLPTLLTSEKKVTLL